ncbi:MAG TPA: regulatory protein RecX [Gaiellaceae bacterium]|nr:regulatory protein RecX [Gaiellaceae bacterium]
MSTRPHRSTSRAPEAREVALRALRGRDLSVSELERRLDGRGFSEDERRATVEALVRTGLADDARLAERRASSLADRGAGDALIRHRLGDLRIARDLVDAALGMLEPESVRARRIVERRGAGVRTARYLAGKGFSEETVREVVAMHGAGELG